MPQGKKDPNKPRPPVPVPDGEELWGLTGEHPDYGEFATGLLVIAGRVYSAPPLVAWMMGKPLTHVIPYAKEKGWTITKHSGPVRQRRTEPSETASTEPVSRSGSHRPTGVSRYSIRSPGRSTRSSASTPPPPGG